MNKSTRNVKIGLKTMVVAALTLFGTIGAVLGAVWVMENVSIGLGWMMFCSPGLCMFYLMSLSNPDFKYVMIGLAAISFGWGSAVMIGGALGGIIAWWSTLYAVVVLLMSLTLIIGKGVRVFVSGRKEART